LGVTSSHHANLPPDIRLSCRPHLKRAQRHRPPALAWCVERTSDVRDRTSAWTTLRLTIRIASSRSAHDQPFATCHEHEVSTPTKGRVPVQMWIDP
jgi:hypothetical protein